MKTNLLLTTLVLAFFTYWSLPNHLSAQSIIGKWIFSNGSETVEFAEEGVFRVLIDTEDYTYGSYELAKDELHFIFFDMEQTFTYAVNQLNDKKLILFNPETKEKLSYNYLGKHEIPSEEIDFLTGLVYDPEENGEDYSSVEKGQVETEKGLPAPGQNHPLAVPSPSNITGIWYCKENNITLTLTNDHYFVRSIMADESVRDIYPDPEVSYGRYKFDGNKLTLLTFSNSLSGEEVIPVENLNQGGFKVPVDFYGDKTYQNWVFNGVPQLSQEDQGTLLSWKNYLKLPGQWRAENEILKFMGDAILFAGKPGSSGSMLVYGVTGSQLEVFELGAGKDEYIYTGKIMELTDHKLVLKGDKDGTSVTYVQEGKPKLTEQEIALYSRYLQMQHRTTMDIIDIMDGVKDWKWIEKEY